MCIVIRTIQSTNFSETIVNNNQFLTEPTLSRTKKKKKKLVVNLNQETTIILVMNTLRNLYIKYNYYIASFILLLIGALIYILFRPQNLLIFDMLDKMGLSNEVDSIRSSFIGIKLPLFVVNCLPAGLWTVSYLIAMYCNTKFHSRKTRLMLSLPLPMSAIVLEFMQLFGWCPGTFDWYDLLCYVIPIIIFIKSI